MHSMNDRAHAEYQVREKPATPIGALRERLRRARPPSISMLLSAFRNAETYNDFVKLVKDFLPEREQEILEKPTPEDQIACFASHFEDRYLPLHPYFKDGEVEEGYEELLRGMPLIVMGFNWEDYHELGDARLGVQLMSYILASPLESYDEGERVALVDGFAKAYQDEARRVPAGGITLDAAKRIFRGERWEGLRNWAQYIYQSTGNPFLDTDEDTWASSVPIEWDKEDVMALSKDWLAAQAYYDKMMDFAAWLEDDKEGPPRYKQVIDFILVHLKEGDVPKPQEEQPR